MMYIRLMFLYFVFFIFIYLSAAFVQLDVDWKSFLSRSDPVWRWSSTSQVPSKWFQSAFTGNGNIGCMITSNSTALRFDVGRTDVYDDRQPGKNYSIGNFVCDRPRLPIGHLNMHFGNNLKNGQMQIELWDAIVDANLQLVDGTISINSFTHSDIDLIVIHVKSDKQSSYQWEWVSVSAQSTWSNDKEACPNYIFNPPWVQDITSDGIQLATQMLLSGNSYTVAWKSIKLSGMEEVMIITVSPVGPNSKEVSIETIRNGYTSYELLLQTHIKWWHSYWPKSFITISDAMVESFWWIQMYKIGSSTREDKTLIDLEGPWYVDNTYWPDLHWDLNIQLTYSPFYTSNRIDIGLSLIRYIDNHIDSFIKNVPIQYCNHTTNKYGYHGDCYAAPPSASSLEGLSSCYWDYRPDCLTGPPGIVGNLLWVLNNYWNHYRYSMDKYLLMNLYKLLKGSVQFYIQFQIDDGIHINLPITFSPEYPLRGPNTNYDISLYRWGLITLIKCQSLLNINDPMLPIWKDILNRLVIYPVDHINDTGYMIASGIPLNISHRHFSHLLMIYPLHLVTWSETSNRKLIEKSLDHWVSLSDGFTGFSRVAASAMSSLTGRPDSSYGNITFLLRNYITPNTMYYEGKEWPCGETPPAAASAIMDWMLQSWDGTIHVFPSVDDKSIHELSFYHLLAEGAFLVSSKRVNGTTKFIQVESLHGEICIITTDMIGPFKTIPSGVTFNVNHNKVTIDLKKGQKVVLLPESTNDDDLVIRPVPFNSNEIHYWGLH